MLEPGPLPGLGARGMIASVSAVLGKRLLLVCTVLGTEMWATCTLGKFPTADPPPTQESNVFAQQPGLWAPIYCQIGEVQCAARTVWSPCRRILLLCEVGDGCPIHLWGAKKMSEEAGSVRVLRNRKSY